MKDRARELEDVLNHHIGILGNLKDSIETKWSSREEIMEEVQHVKDLLIYQLDNLSE